MRGWGRAPICKASRPDHRLGIQATDNIVEGGNKERCGRGRKTHEECIDDRLSSRVQGRTEKSECFGRREMASGVIIQDDK